MALSLEKELTSVPISLSWFLRLKKFIDKWRYRCAAGKHYQCPEQKQNENNRKEPIFFPHPHKAPQVF